jgi:hypothetical protein
VVNVAALKETAEKRFRQAFLDRSQWWEPLGSPIAGLDPREATYSENVLVLDGANLSPQQDDPDPVDWAADSTTFTTTVYEKLKTVTNQDARDTDIVENTVAAWGALAADTLADLMFDVLTAATTTASPMNGSNSIAANGGGTLFICDSYDMTHPQGTTTSAQSNTSTAALSVTQVRNDISTHWSYLDYHGRRMRNYAQKPILIAPIDLLGTTDQIAMLNTVLYDGAGLVSPVNQHLDQSRGMANNNGIVTLPGNAADPNDWWMLWVGQYLDSDSGAEVTMGPIRPWIRKAPEIEVNPSPNSNHVHIIVEAEYGVVVSPFVHFDLIMHAVA